MIDYKGSYTMVGDICEALFGNFKHQSLNNFNGFCSILPNTTASLNQAFRFCLKPPYKNLQQLCSCSNPSLPSHVNFPSHHHHYQRHPSPTTDHHSTFSSICSYFRNFSHYNNWQNGRRRSHRFHHRTTVTPFDGTCRCWRDRKYSEWEWADLVLLALVNF